MNDVKSTDNKKAPCSLTREDNIISWNDVEVYSYGGNDDAVITVSYYPRYFDPIYAPLAVDGQGKPEDLSKIDLENDYAPAILYIKKNGVMTQVSAQFARSIGTESGGSLTNIDMYINDPINEYRIFSNSIEGYHRNIDDNKYSSEVGIELLSYKDAPETHTEQERKIVIFADPATESKDPLHRYLNQFFGTVEGFYVAPYACTVLRGLTIITRPIYGFVRLRTFPDSRFYLQYERNDKGIVVGEVIRTRFIPFMETATRGEIEGCFEDQDGNLVPVCYSYYDPAGSGKRITREEYQAYLRQRKNLINELTALPTVLTNLLGF